jgi:serine/threonine protein kinase/Tfp pilus assembly protein PilF
VVSQPAKTPDRFQFGDDFELDLRAYELRSAGIPLKLNPIPMQLLLLLLERRGELVTREQMVERIWGKGVFLDTDNSINGAVSKIRQVLRDNAEQPRFVQTVTGKGYRFVAAVIEVTPAAAGAATEGDPSAAHTLLGKKITHYRILQLLGGGGMGVVYKAEDLKLGRRVAIKFLPAELAGDPTSFERLEREARAASALEHPNICPIYELGEHEGQPFIVMQLLDGQTLQDRIETTSQQKTPLPADEVLDLALQVVAGLEAAHEKGIIHRDVKPANIFITNRGEAKILDFGLAKVVESEIACHPEAGQSDLGETAPAASTAASANLRLTQTGTTVGTAHYMSPEQVRGEKLDARTDLFSFGLVLYEMATGQRAFPGNTVPVIHDAILHKTPLPIEQISSEHSPLEPVISKAIEKDRGLRYQSAADIRMDLLRLKRDSLSELTPAATSGGGAAAEASAVRVSVVWKIAIPILLAVLLAGGIYYRSLLQGMRLTDKDTIVVADFANSTGDPVFDTTLKQALSIALNQSPFLNVLSDNKVGATLQRMARPANTALVPEVARELCQRAGSRVYIAGSINTLGNQYVVGLKAVNCRSGDVLAQEQVTAASKEKVLGALDSAARQMRGELGESLATLKKFDLPLEDATTSSLEALEAYSTGVATFRQKGAAAALPYHLRAIQLDPNFAGAYSAVGSDYYDLGELTRASEYFTKAFQLRDHASRKESLTFTANYYIYVTGELDQAAQALHNVIANYPRMGGPHTDLGNVYTSQGLYEKASEEYHESIRLFDDGVVNYQNLTNTLMALQRFQEARQEIQDAQARKVDDYILHMQTYALAFLAADSAGMAEQQHWFTGHPELEHNGLSLASDTEAYAGHLSKARELTTRSVDTAIRADSQESGAIWQENAALREAAFGNAIEAKRLATEGLKLAPASQGVQVEAALAFAMAGDTTRPISLANEIKQRFPQDTEVQSLWLSAIQAQLALDGKKPVAALAALPDSGPLELGQISFLNNLSCLYPTYIRGEAFLAAGEGSAAAAEFQKILDHSGIVWNCWTGALAHLGVARANTLQARTSQGADADAARDRSLAAYKEFLTLWKDADPDLPILKAAKVEYAKLQ